jgi:hypothetical protein
VAETIKSSCFGELEDQKYESEAKQLRVHVWEMIEITLRIVHLQVCQGNTLNVGTVLEALLDANTRWYNDQWQKVKLLTGAFRTERVKGTPEHFTAIHALAFELNTVPIAVQALKDQGDEAGSADWAVFGIDLKLGVLKKKLAQTDVVSCVGGTQVLQQLQAQVIASVEERLLQVKMLCICHFVLLCCCVCPTILLCVCAMSLSAVNLTISV